MAFRLKHGQSLEREVRRIADKQLELAITRMRGIGNRKSDEAIHQARRHVKKVRALIRLVQPAFGSAYRGTNKRLRAVNRLLAPIADGETVVGTLVRLGKEYRRELPPQTFVAMRKGLFQRLARLDQQAMANHVLPTSATLLRNERKRVHGWRLNARGFRTIGPGLRQTVRAARRAMALALARPSVPHYRAWRRRVKDHWFQVRLLEGRCADELVGIERGLEALDGCLGDYHNCALLQRILRTDALLPRAETARSLHLLRRYQRDLRIQAEHLGAQIYSETPRQFVKRVKTLWRSTAERTPTAPTKGSWHRAA